MHRRILFILALFSSSLYSQGFVEGFDTVTNLFSNGWVQQNNSTPLGSGIWAQDNGNFPDPIPSPPTNSSIVVGYTSIASGQSGDISNWLITPTISMSPGDSIIFYTISYQNSAYPDRLEVRLNRNNTTDVGSSTTSVGDFDTTLFTINPNLITTSGGYPMIWKRYACIINGIAPLTACRIGLRYFVTDGGQTGSNSSTIGIDNFEYKTALIGIENQSPLFAYTQLINGQIVIEIPEATHSFTAEIIDMWGRILHHADCDKSCAFDVGNYCSGVYLIKIVYEGKYLIKKISF